jgi:hypothetical protein
MSGQSYMGINTSPNASYFSWFNDIDTVAGPLMGQLVIEGGIGSVQHIHTKCGILCDYLNGIAMEDSYVGPGGNTQWGVVGTSYGEYSNNIFDNENGGSCPAFTLEQDLGNGTGNFQLNENDISACANSTAPIYVDNGNSVQIALVGNYFSWGGSPPAIVHMLAFSGNNARVTFSGNNYKNQPVSSIPYTDGGIAFSASDGSTQNLTTVNGTTAGHAYWAEPTQGSGLISAYVNLVGYENTTGTAQTITLPLAFSTIANTVVAKSGSCTGVTVAIGPPTVITLPSSMGATLTGFCTVDGY